MRCPTCRKELDRDDPFWEKWAPFCSERCKLLDLGKWLDEAFAIPGEPAPIPDASPEEDEDSQH